MNRGAKKLLIVLGVICAGLFALWLFVFPTSSLHYKLSVDIDDNGVVRHGEGVFAVYFASQGLRIGDMSSWAVNGEGEAFAVEIGQRGTLFVLTNDVGTETLWQYFGFNIGDFPSGFASKLKIDEFARSQTSVTVKPEYYPTLVHFRNTNDPDSVSIVLPDRLDAVFGPGVAIRQIRANITREPLTSGIEKKLPWLADKNTWAGTRFKGLDSPTWQIIRGLYMGNSEAHFK